MGEPQARADSPPQGRWPERPPDAPHVVCPSCGALLYLDPNRTHQAVPHPAIPRTILTALGLTANLSPREQAAFQLLGLGYDNRSLARELAVSERTAKRHVTAILEKLRLESRLQAGLAALLTMLQVVAAEGSTSGQP